MPENSNDRRVRRTKKLMREGLMQLMQTKPVKDISVKELSDLVDINRGTFYLYYRDIFDMVRHLEDELFESIGEIIVRFTSSSEQPSVLAFFTVLLQFVKENSNLFKLLIGPNGDSQFSQRLSNTVRENYRIKLHATKTDIDETEFNHKYSFAIFGLIGLIHYWLQQDCTEPVESLAATATDMTISVFMLKETPH